MFVVGITGSIGMGKSTATKMLRAMGYPVFDADESINKLFENKEIIEQIKEFFPQAVPDGRAVKKEVLRGLVFMNDEQLDVLEKITHPFVKKDRESFIEQKKVEGKKLVFLDIPLLFEIGANTEVDAVVVIAAPKFIQERRVLNRGNISKNQLSFLQKRQIPSAQKTKNADYIIYSCFGFTVMRWQLKRMVNKIEKMINIQKSEVKQ